MKPHFYPQPVFPSSMYLRESVGESYHQDLVKSIGNVNTTGTFHVYNIVINPIRVNLINPRNPRFQSDLILYISFDKYSEHQDRTVYYNRILIVQLILFQLFLESICHDRKENLWHWYFSTTNQGQTIESPDKVYQRR